MVGWLGGWSDVLMDDSWMTDHKMDGWTDNKTDDWIDGQMDRD